MNFTKIVTAVLTALALTTGMTVLPVQNADVSEIMTVRAAEGTYGVLTYVNHGSSIEITGCEESAGNVIIPDQIDGLPVTSIGTRAFYYCSSLTSVSIPNSVTSIGDTAFYHCSSLTSLNIPGSVRSIGDSAFYRCEHLTSVTLPDSVTSIGDSAFYECTSLTSVTVPGSVASIGYAVFAYCTSLRSVTLLEGVTALGLDVFGYCTSLTSVSIPNSATRILGYAFHECKSLTDVYYAGTETAWNALEIPDEGNSYLLRASVHYNNAVPDTSETVTNEPTYGDVDCNNSINLMDVILLNQNLMTGTYITEQGTRNADVDRNGTLNPVDSLNILKYCIKLITLPV